MIQETRQIYRPFEYPWAYDYYRLQQSVHWTKDEIKLGEDLQNWNKDLTETEKQVIGGILKGFTQMEILVGDYWRKVANWFPKPEIAMMASTNSYFESIHMDNYSMINEQLGLDDYSAFLYDEATKDKLEYFINIPDRSDIKDIAKSIAIFSAFAEGVQLFSSFAVLLSFKRENLMKNVGQIVSFSIRDENLHSEGGIKIFQEICKENPGLKEDIEEEVLAASRIVLSLERLFISSLFKDGNLRTITKEELTNFVHYRLNLKLSELGYSYKYPVNSELLQQMSWFGDLSSGREFTDFFSSRVTEYTKYEVDPNTMF
jgi:ribonucleoside-diphosphate reductase beta chain